MRYVVYSIGPHEVTVEATLSDGRKVPHVLCERVAELLPADGDAGHGTVKLVGAPEGWAVGDTIEATFTKVPTP